MWTIFCTAIRSCPWVTVHVKFYWDFINSFSETVGKNGQICFRLKYDLGHKYYAPQVWGFRLMTSRSWQCTSCYWDACSNHSAISDFKRWPKMFLVKVRLRAQVLRTTSWGFRLMTSRSWQYTSCHREACSNHSAISDFKRWPGKRKTN